MTKDQNGKDKRPPPYQCIIGDEILADLPFSWDSDVQLIIHGKKITEARRLLPHLISQPT